MQVSLFGQRVQEINEKFEKAEEPWKDVCCRACWFAKGKRCVCRCGGRYHGKGRARNVTHDYVAEYHEVMNHFCGEL